MCVTNQRKTKQNTQAAPGRSLPRTGENPKELGIAQLVLCQPWTMAGAEASGTTAPPRSPNTTCPGSGVRWRGQLLPLHRRRVKSISLWITQGSQGLLAGCLGPGGRGTPVSCPSYLVLSGPGLGHPQGARCSEARPTLVRTWPPPAWPRRCGCASAAWHTGAGQGPREACPVGRDSSGSRGSPRAPRLPPAPRP